MQNLASQGTRSVQHQMTGQQQSGMIQWIQTQQLQNQGTEIIQPQMNPQMAQNQGNNGLLANQSLNAICSICMDVLSKNCVSTSCGHIYHGSCLEKWLITYVNPKVHFVQIFHFFSILGRIRVRLAGRRRLPALLLSCFSKLTKIQLSF